MIRGPPLLFLVTKATLTNMEREEEVLAIHLLLFPSNTFLCLLCTDTVLDNSSIALNKKFMQLTFEDVDHYLKKGKICNAWE